MLMKSYKVETKITVKKSLFCASMYSALYTSAFMTEFKFGSHAI